MVNLDIDHHATVGKIDRLPLVVNLNIDYYATVGERVFLSRQTKMPTQQLVNLEVDHCVTVGKMDR